MRLLLPTIPHVEELAMNNPSVGGLVCQQAFISHVNTETKLGITFNNLDKGAVCSTLSVTINGCT